MKDDKYKKPIITHRITLTDVTEKPKPNGIEPNTDGGNTDEGMAKRQESGGEALTPRSTEITAEKAAMPKRRVATVDNIMLPETPNADDEAFEDELDDEPAAVNSKKPRKGEHIPAWSIVLLFAVIAVLAAILLYFFVLKNDDASAVAPTETQIEIIFSTPTITPTEAPTITPTEAPTPTPVPTPSTMWGANFPGKFTTGEIIKNDSTVTPTLIGLSPRFQDCEIEVAGSYKSEHVNVTLNKVKEKGITYFVADIYITDLKYLTSPFSSGKYNKGSYKLVYQIAKANDAIVAINADFYTRNRGPVLRDGVLYRNEKGHDMLVMLNDGTMQTYAKGKFDKNTVKELKGKAWQIWTFGPMLIKDGQPMTKFNLPNPIGGDNPRTAVGYYEPGHYLFVTVDGRQKGYSYPGYSMKELSQLMYDLGCKVAFNLDGGASAQMAFMGKKASKPCWTRRDPDALCIIDEPAPEESAAPTAGN